MGAALFMLVSTYGFNDVVVKGLIIADPPRVAAQIVSGVGFPGAGLIFVRRDSVRGLAAAASIWVTAAVGAAAGAGLGILAGEATAGFLVVTTALPALARRPPRSPAAGSALLVRYPDGRGVLCLMLQTVTGQGCTIGAVSASSLAGPAAPGPGEGRPMTEVSLHVHRRHPSASWPPPSPRSTMWTPSSPSSPSSPAPPASPASNQIPAAVMRSMA